MQITDFSHPKAKDVEFLSKLVENAMPSIGSKRHYRRGVRAFMEYWRNEDYPRLTKGFLNQYVIDLQAINKGEVAINIHLAAIRKLAYEATDNQIWPQDVAYYFSRVKDLSVIGTKIHTWLTAEQAQQLINLPDEKTWKGLRDRALICTLVGCGLRRSELSDVTVEHLKIIEERWAIVNLVGKHNHVRAIPIPTWAKAAIDAWMEAAEIKTGFIFQSIVRGSHLRGRKIPGNSIWEVVNSYGQQLGVSIGPHDLRRTFAKLAHQAGAPLEQIQLSLGHQSLKTTEIYLGIDQDFKNAPGDLLPLSLNDITGDDDE